MPHVKHIDRIAADFEEHTIDSSPPPIEQMADLLVKVLVLRSQRAALRMRLERVNDIQQAVVPAGRMG
jgi:hypothetical protein